MPFLFPRSLVCTAPSAQGHVKAAEFIGCIYNFGQGVAVDYKRAMAAYKIGAEGGDAICQFNLGWMLRNGRGIDSPDYEQALVWFGKAAAQGVSQANGNLGSMASHGQGQEPSWRRAREHYQRAIDLGDTEAFECMQIVNDSIQEVNRFHAGDSSGSSSQDI